MFVTQARSQWQNLASVEAEVRSIYFTSRDTGYAVGGPKIYSTVDAGLTWKPYYLKNSTGVFAVQFLNSTIGYAAGDGMYKTTDGGALWAKVNVGGDPSVGGFNLYFADEFSGILQGSKVFFTRDGGHMWEEVIDPFNLGGTLRTMVFKNDSIGYIGGYVSSQFTFGTYAYTLDTGRTWTRLSGASHGTEALLIEAMHVDSSLFCLGGETGGVGRFAMKRLRINRLDGLGWDTTAFNFSNTILKVLFVDNLNGYVGDDAGNIFATTDAGHTWAKENVATNGKPVYTIYAAFGNLYAAAGQTLFKKSLATSTKEYPAESKYSVSPNPSSGIVRVMLGSEFGDAKTAITVIDAL
ncbi:MAG: hypothetical protein SGJ05_04570, partial [bacterium]|nr:hypothetical protein [bacterium]